MRMCNYTAHETYYDPGTGNQTGTGGFFGAYKATYDPNRVDPPVARPGGQPPAGADAARSRRRASASSARRPSA